MALLADQTDRERGEAPGSIPGNGGYGDRGERLIEGSR
jgi:hypothetical protein